MGDKPYNAILSSANPYFYLKVKRGRLRRETRKAIMVKFHRMTDVPLIFQIIKYLLIWSNLVKSKQQISTGDVI